MKRKSIQAAVKQAIEPNWINKTLFLGDNLHVMRRMNSSLIDLIYLDPPFNSNQIYTHAIGKHPVFRDIWHETDLDKAEHALLANYSGEDLPLFARERRAYIHDVSPLYSAIAGARATHGGSMFSYLVWMSLRLIEMRRLLKETGSIYLHCDPTASHYLKMVMDAIFGPENFRNEVVWWYYNGSSATKRFFPRKHDIILFYAKNHKANPTFNPDAVRIPYEPTSGWLKGKNKDSYGNPNPKGKVSPDVFRIPSINNMAKERTGYPTQKPEKLLERILKASSNDGDMVFDPFCGCATSLVVAEKLGRQWVGIDIVEQAAKEIKKRMVKLAIDRGEHELAIWKGITNRDLRKPKQLDKFQRTDQGKLPASRTHAKWLFGEQEGKCGGVNGGGCGGEFRIGNLEVDHIVPKSKGGTDHPSNLQLLCGACNKMKSDKPQAYLDAQLKKQGIILH